MLTNKIIAVFFAVCFFAGNLYSQQSWGPNQPTQSIYYQNASDEAIDVFSQVVYPGAPEKFVSRLLPGQSHASPQGMVGSRTIFRFASDQSNPVEQRNGFARIDLRRQSGSSVRPHQEPRTIRVKNNTGDDVLVYRKGTYPGASPEFVRRLRSHSSFEKSRGFGVTFVYKPANGIGQIQEVEMITQESGKMLALIKVHSSPRSDDFYFPNDRWTNGPAWNQSHRPGTVKVFNRTGEEVMVYRTGVYPGAQPELIKRLQPGGMYRKNVGLVGSTVSFTCARSGRPVRQQEFLTESGRAIALVIR